MPPPVESPSEILMENSGFPPGGRLPRISIGGLMVMIAVITATGWSIGEAFRPSYPRGWVIARVTVQDGPIVPPFGNTRAPEAEQESHVRLAVSDEVLRAAAPDRDPGVLRTRLHVWCNPPNSLYISTLSDDPPTDLALIDSVAASYRGRSKATLFHPAVISGHRVYPRALPVGVGLAGLAIAYSLVMVGRSIASRRRGEVAEGPPARP